MRRLLLACALLLAAPTLAAQPGGAIDATIALSPDEPPAAQPSSIVRANGTGEDGRHLFDLTLAREHTTLEVRASGFALDRPRQLVPSLLVAEDRYPLFHDFPHERVWEVDGPSNIAHAGGTGDEVVLRLGVAGPRNVTLALTVDRTPPNYTIGERRDLTHIGYYQETRTDEMALADMQVRRVGSEEWVQNPTPEYHVLQRFPVQGLDPATDYEMRVVFTDWAGNEVVSPVERFTTPPAPEVPAPVVRPLAPAPNATVPAGNITIRAAIDAVGSPVHRAGVRLFFDLQEITEGIRYQDGEVSYTPATTLADGLHRVSVEATNEMGGTAAARWSFQVGSATTQATPLPALVSLAALVLAPLLARR